MARILLVEDNEMNRDMLSRRLRRRGHDVLLAADGAEGVRRARADAPDVVLMDMSLPVLDGWEATRRLKGDPTTRGIPVVALTAHAMTGDREQAMAAGCDDFDTKPVELERLLAKVEALLARARPDELVVERASAEDLARLRRFVVDACARAGASAEARDALELAVDEACTNIVIHGYAGGPGPIRVTFRREAAGASVTIADRGAPFAPERAPPPDLDAAWDAREPGGLGWHLIQRVVDAVHYAADADDGNRLTLVKRWPAPND